MPGSECASRIETMWLYCDTAVGSGPTYFHDLLSIDSPEAKLITDMDKHYSRASRLASELGGPMEKLWGALTLAGGTETWVHAQTTTCERIACVRLRQHA